MRRRAWLVDPGDVVATARGPRSVADVLVDGSIVVLVFTDGTEARCRRRDIVIVR